jgi:hypothetical protein
MDATLGDRSDRLRRVVLAIVVASTAIGVMIFASAFPLLPLWVRDLGISHAKTGALTGLWYVTGIFVALPIGWLADRLWAAALPRSMAGGLRPFDSRPPAWPVPKPLSNCFRTRAAQPAPTTTISTRRFCCRPALVVFEATGCVAPYPLVAI